MRLPTFDDDAWLRNQSKTIVRTEQERNYIQNFQASAEDIIRRGLISFETAPRLMHIPFTIICNDECNAFAMPSLGEYRYRIAFYDGLIFSLLKDLVAACIHPEMRSWLPAGTSPADCAVILSFIAHEFLLWHEISHIVNGHLDICSASNSGFIIAETSGRKFNSFSAMDSQAFEINADSTAAVIAIRSVITMHHQVSNQSLSVNRRGRKELEVFWQNGDLAIRLFFFAIARLFLLFGPEEYDLNTLENLSHPPALLRMIFIAQQVELWFARNVQEIIDTPLYSLAVDTYAKAEKCLSADRKGFSSPSHFHWSNDPHILSHFDKLHAHLREVTPRIESCKLGGKPRSPRPTVRQ